MELLRTQVKNFLAKKDDSKHIKDSFWATDSEKNQFEIFHSFKGTPQTNPNTPESQFGLMLRTKVEELIVDTFREMDILVEPEPYTDRDGVLIEKPDQHRVEMNRLGVKITGYIDAVIMEEGKEVPVEIKTSYGPYGKKELEMGMPKMSYLKQLAQYMDYMGVNKGYILQAHFKDCFLIDEIYQFVLTRDGSEFTCISQKFDIYNDVYKRYERINNDYIKTGIEPPSEYFYKYPVDQIDWKAQPKYKISNARNNKAVIGDWQVLYSNYKNLIIQKEGEILGYSDAELQKIKELTKGFTNWK